MFVEFWVPGVPASQGSKKAFVVGGRAVVVEDCARNRPWRLDVEAIARYAMRDTPMFSGPVELGAVFHFKRPKSHFGSGKNGDTIREKAPKYHTSKPDLCKVLRALEDALTNVVYFDDSQIVRYSGMSKIYGDKPGVRVVVEEVS